jgi:hypothetical protein
MASESRDVVDVGTAVVEVVLISNVGVAPLLGLVGGEHCVGGVAVVRRVMRRCAVCGAGGVRSYNEKALPIADVVAIAHAASVPVLVDAASRLPPVTNLWHFTGAGVDLAIFSCGKARAVHSICILFCFCFVACSTSVVLFLNKSSAISSFLLFAFLYWLFSAKPSR